MPFSTRACPPCQEGKTLPRRQEAEQDAFPDGTGQTRTALVTPEELEQWQSDDDALIMAVSHCWETKQHPDPTNHQIRHIANYTGMHYVAYRKPIWLFYDYVSLFQYKRETAEQDACFARGLSHIFLFYAHEFTYTLRVESLTPQHLLELNADGCIAVYDKPSERVKEVPLHRLDPNRTLYLDRGWCRSELEWSSMRSQTERNVRIDGTNDRHNSTMGARAPTPPEIFRKTIAQLHFTQKKADLQKVARLHAKVYNLKASPSVGAGAVVMLVANSSCALCQLESSSLSLRRLPPASIYEWMA